MNALEVLTVYPEAPDLAAGWYDKGVAAVKAGEIEEACDAFRQVLRIEPENAPAYNGLGICYHFMGDKKAADASYQKAAQLDPRFARALHTTLMDRLATLYRHKFLRPGMSTPAPTQPEDDEDDAE